MLLDRIRKLAESSLRRIGVLRKRDEAVIDPGIDAKMIMVTVLELTVLVHGPPRCVASLEKVCWLIHTGVGFGPSPFVFRDADDVQRREKRIPI